MTSPAPTVTICPPGFAHGYVATNGSEEISSIDEDMKDIFETMMERDRWVARRKARKLEISWWR